MPTRVPKDQVQLRPFERDEMGWLARAGASPQETGEFQWFGWRHGEAHWLARFDEGLLAPDSGVLAIEAEGQLVGHVAWFESYWGWRSTSACWTIAIGIADGHRGRGIGTIAQRLLVDYLFTTTPIHRIQAFTDVENTAERRALISAGMSEEGTVRQSQWRAGGWHDMVLYAVVRPEWRRETSPCE